MKRTRSRRSPESSFARRMHASTARTSSLSCRRIFTALTIISIWKHHTRWPRLLRKAHEAKTRNEKKLIVWGTGKPRREFLHVDDLAAACLLLLEKYDSPEIINIGCGEDVTIRELAELICDVVGFNGELVWDKTKPDGTPRKLLDVTRIRALGWQPTIPLRKGIAQTYEWFLANRAQHDLHCATQGATA